MRKQSRKRLLFYIRESSAYKNKGLLSANAMLEFYYINMWGNKNVGNRYQKTSDIDLAIEGGDSVRFALDVDEFTSTLLKYDIVDLNGIVQEELLQSIKREGVVIYEKI